MIIWITGLSGSGKTTLAKKLYLYFKRVAPNTIWIDGDNLRKDVAPEIGYSKKERDQLFSKTYGFIKFCNNQNLNVIVSVLKFSKKIEKENKKNFKKYFLIYLNSNINLLIKHDSKKIYKKNLKKKKPNIVGYDIKWENPVKPNLEIKDFFLQSKKNVNFIIKSRIFKKLKL
tara:strand:- start:415 stop:930 length:516 start_codon:yes stop_codon:yes gene_type:complete